MTPTARSRPCNVGVYEYDCNLTGQDYSTTDPVRHLLHGHTLGLESNPGSEINISFDTFSRANSELFAVYSDMPNTFIYTENIVTTHYMPWIYT